MDKSTNRLQLELHVDDFETIKEYYSKLGFRVLWERQPEESKGYLVMELEENTICFWGGNEYIYKQTHFSHFPSDTPRGYGVEIVVMVNDVRAYYDSVKDTAEVVEPLMERPWGLWDFRVVDPAGYYLRFTTEHDIRNASNAVT